MAENQEDRVASAGFGPFVKGLLAAVAMGSLMSGGSGTASQAVPVATGMGLVAAVIASARSLAGLGDFFYSAIGVIASLPTMTRFLSTEVMIGGAALLGWLVISAGDWVCLAGVAFIMYGIHAASLGSSCRPANYSGATLIVMFAIAYFLARAVMRRFAARE